MTRTEEMRSLVEQAINQLERGQAQAALDSLKTALHLDTVQEARALGIAPAFYAGERVLSSAGLRAWWR